MATYATYTPFPGTDTWESLKGELTVSPHEYELWDMLHLTIASELKPFEYYTELLRLYMITIFSPAGRKTILRKYGNMKGLLVSVMILKSAAEFMLKLLFFGSAKFLRKKRGKRKKSTDDK